MILLEISRKIRAMRQSQGMTVEQLARRSGFSKGFISQIENFRQTPSLKALVKIAEALGMPVSLLFEDESATSPNYTFGNLTDGVEVERDDGRAYGIRYFALANTQLDRTMNPFVIEYTPATPREFKLHDTEEFFVLLEGELNYFLYDDTTCRRMKSGDTLYMRANIPHRVELADGCTHAKGLVIYGAPQATSKEGLTGAFPM